MKRFRWIFVLVLAAVMLFVSPVQVLAAAQVKYVSELRIGYGDEGKTALEAEGFKVWTDLNANEGGNGSAVWIGYKTTTNKSEAITDVAVMNMQGGYSFDAYTQELEELNRKVSAQLANFEATVLEFRENYAAGNIFAESALEAMNAFTDDDTLGANGEPASVGDILLDPSTSEETLHRIFLEGNTEAIKAVENALAAACIETGDDNVLARLEETEYPDKLDPAGNDARANLKAAFADFRSDAIAAQTVYNNASEYEGGIKAFMERDNLSEDEYYTYSSQLSHYDLLSRTMFGDSGMTLLEFALLDEEEPNENGEVLEDEYLDMMAQAMTPGQLGIVANVGIMTILVNAMAGTALDEAEEMLDEYVDTEDAEKISVYYGVDRTLFSDTGTVALTSSALREKAASQKNDFGKDTSADPTGKIILTAAAATALTVGAVATTIGVRSLILTSKDVMRDMAAEMAEQVIGEAAVANGQAAGASSAAVGGILTAVGIIAIIAAVVLTIFALLKWLEKPEVPKTEYTQIPRVIVDKPDEGEGFIAYYAAKLAGASETETDSTKLYGDLNGLNGKDQWLALYYTKNTTKGTPLKAEIFSTSKSTPSFSEPLNYTAVHLFGTSATLAADLNQFSTGNSNALYLYFRNSYDEVSQTGSVFSGSVLTGVVTFIVGGGLAAAATYLAMKKKYSKTVKEAQ